MQNFWMSDRVVFFKNDAGQRVTVNGRRYRVMITNFFVSQLDKMDMVPAQRHYMPHSSRNNLFTERKAGSCYFTPRDYFLRGYVVIGLCGSTCQVDAFGSKHPASYWRNSSPNAWKSNGKSDYSTSEGVAEIICGKSFLNNKFYKNIYSILHYIELWCFILFKISITLRKHPLYELFHPMVCSYMTFLPLYSYITREVFLCILYDFIFRFTFINIFISHWPLLHIRLKFVQFGFASKSYLENDTLIIYRVSHMSILYNSFGFDTYLFSIRFEC